MYLDKFAWALFLFIASISVGLIGYMRIEQFDLVSAFYMTVITLSTVGFTEVRELSSEGRVFTSFYILFNLGFYAYAASVITRYFMEGEIRNRFEKLRKEKKIQKMKDHVIVCGFGRNGSKATEELVKNGVSVVVVEIKNDDFLLKQSGPAFKDVVFISGDATTDEILIQAGIHKAKAIISSLPNDANNVFIALTAREMNANIFIVARASDPHSEIKLKRAGANCVVMPDYIGGLHMAGVYLRTHTSYFSNIPSGKYHHDCNLQEVKFKELGTSFIGKRPSEINSLLQGTMIVGYKTKEGKLIINPTDDKSFEEEDILLMLYGSGIQNP